MQPVWMIFWLIVLSSIPRLFIHHKRGKPITKLYLTAALFVFNNDSFKYLREVISGNNAVLEFSTVIEGITVNGVDMITWGADGRITEFKVMVRPLKAINLIHRMMGEMLQKIK
jgi:hypothetical protein